MEPKVIFKFILQYLYYIFNNLTVTLELYLELLNGTIYTIYLRDPGLVQ